jgi:fumarate reductase subunit C
MMDRAQGVTVAADYERRVPTSGVAAKLDVVQSLSGLALALFMWAHMLFVSSILLGKDAMWTVTKFFEGYWFFGRAYPWLVSVSAGAVTVLFIASSRTSSRRPTA